MFNSFGAKLAMKKLGIPKDALSFLNAPASAEPKPTTKKANTASQFDRDDNDNDSTTTTSSLATTPWPTKWMTVKNLPLTVQPWLSTAPPPVPVAAQCPAVGDPAPLDRDAKLVVGKGRKVVVVFLRCVGCAFAQRTFLALRALSAKSNHTQITCIAISHASAAATAKWLDLIGGAWNVQVLIDDDRAIYAAWGLGLSSVWYYFNPATQTAAWKADKGGWLGARVAGSIARTGDVRGTGPAPAPAPGRPAMAGSAGAQKQQEGGQVVQAGGETPVMGNKWQQGGAFAIDERGVVVWGGKAKSADEMMDLEAGFAALFGNGARVGGQV
ncbi:hypothetical protein BD289DRAFT_379466 [Coniella lustricola]|uniref:AhpC/TSA antioxidant enzyme-domain-containing protein n=1 Tax=Coniella lustricola TaxID=2025994 RepID=A0A2T2ZSM1_9PEZI|nr:hypothetical protein BD289DRAFT_379466 [Coniella lustricola]